VAHTPGQYGARSSYIAGAVLLPQNEQFERLPQRRLGIHCLCGAILEWFWNLTSPAGAAWLAAIVCFATQTICMWLFLQRYIHNNLTRLTLFSEVPIFLHLIWYWREESACQACASQWIAYSLIHAGKVVVLFCKVMPRFPTLGNNGTRTGWSAQAGQGVGVFQDFFSPTVLANLLLITPLFYSILMFRASRSIFGSSSTRITSELLMHYDMLWHVAIDMVDQADMFRYARLGEWVSAGVVEQHETQLVAIQAMVPVVLFISMILQSQSFPGVVANKWEFPIPPVVTSAVSSTQQDHLAATKADPNPESPCFPPPPSVENESSVPSKTPPQGPPPDMSRGAAPSSSSSAPPPPPPTPLCALAPALPRRLPEGPLLWNAAPRHSNGQVSAMTAEQHQGSPGVLATSQRTISRVTFREVPRPSTASTASSTSSASALRARSRAPSASALERRTRGRSWGTTRGSRVVSLRDPQVSARDRHFKAEKDRRSRLEYILQLVQRQSIVIARKRSAAISIFFIDIPFLTLRVWLWVLTLQKGRADFPGLVVKNAVCIVLNCMQYTVVRISSSNSFFIIQREMAIYTREVAHKECSNSATDKGTYTYVSSGSESESSPMQSSLRVKPAGKDDSGPCSEEKKKQTARGFGLCSHFFVLLICFSVGWLFAKGESKAKGILSGLVENIEKTVSS